MTWEFEWDEHKRVANLRKHGVDFIDAVEAFNDPRLTLEEDRSELYDETRMIATGVALGQLVVITFTERGENLLRVISARPATKREKRRYGANQAH